MASLKDALRRQRRRELDARRSKSRIRLGSCQESWGKLKKTLGFSLHSELAQYLLDSYFSKVCSRCSGDGTRGILFITAASLQQLVLLVHSHSQHCPFPPSLQFGPKTFLWAEPKASMQGGPNGCIQADPTGIINSVYKGITQDGPEGVTQAGPEGVTQAGPEGVTQAGPVGLTQAGPVGLTQAGPVGLTQAGPKGVTQAGPEGLTQAGPEGLTQTSPEGITQANPKGPTSAPTSSIQGDPKTLMQGDPEGSMLEDPYCAIQAGHESSMQTKPKTAIQADPKSLMQADPEGSIQADPKESVQTEASLQAQMCLTYACEGGHVFTWCVMQTVLEVEDTEGSDGEGAGVPEDAASPAQKSIRRRGRRAEKEGELECTTQEVTSSMRTRGGRRAKSDEAENSKDSKEKEGLEGEVPNCSGEDEEPEELEEHMSSEEGSDAVLADVSPRAKTKNAVPKPTKRGRQRRVDSPETNNSVNTKPVRRKRNNRQQPGKDDMSQICSKRKRKATPKLILPCEFDGCWKIFSSRQYLNHHMKYQHVQQKTFICSHPSCGKSFNFKKHLKEHEKLHSDQRDYICEFCARAFRTSSNLSIHRRIHTGEKPLQCEVCGYTCRQKASLNWHMRKHDAESSYKFPCEVCGRRFEKRDNVSAHRSKSHPEHFTTSVDTPSLKPT
ncbi:zinc finger protein 692 isoform X2 [Salminus brasiliensis]|uniref:zinc finger protein 692 isoform X2 n=1 Tax=Salminus brasiliensis TaxID=930266 RepID=UPI003B833ECB